MSPFHPSFFDSTGISGSPAGFREYCISPTGTRFESAETKDLSPTAVLTATEPANYFRIKHAVDRLVTALLCIVALPLIGIVAAAILLLDGRPVFYRQNRVGKQGREFSIWKFRTMKPNAEHSTGAVWSCATDPRVTALGRWLRCSHLDELPQFFNILSGDMNLVGPRPERPEFARELAREFPRYPQRTAVRPGITGLSQLRLGYDDSVANVRKKLLLDLRYVRSATLLQDVWLLMCTLPYVAQQLVHKAIDARRRSELAEDNVQSVEQLVAPPIRVDPKEPSTIPVAPFPRLLSATNGVPVAVATIDHIGEECA